MIVRRLIFEDAAQTFRVVLADDVVKHMFRLCDANRSRETAEPVNKNGTPSRRI